MSRKTSDSKGQQKNVLVLIKPYLGYIIGIFILTLLSNGLSLVMPKIISAAIDTLDTAHQIQLSSVVTLSIVVILVLVFTALQGLLQIYVSEKVARDVRNQLISRISVQPFSFINQITPEKLLTILTSDVDNIKQIISIGIVQVFSSIIIVVGASALLISVNRPLAFVVLTIIPIIIVIFVSIFSHIRQYFMKAQAVIDRLNKTINESIVAASLIRILNSQSLESSKFLSVNTESQNIGLSILKLFSSLIPLISITANLSIVAILLLGGRFIIQGTFTIGGMSAFLSYVSMLIFPIIIIGFISNIFARAGASFERISLVLYAPVEKWSGQQTKDIKGEVSFKDVTLEFGGKEILKKISFDIPAGSRTAILGPTAAGKTQIFYLLAGLLKPTSGKILIDNIPLTEYSSRTLADQIGLVFQDSSIFNTTIRENINFRQLNNEKALNKAIQTAELSDFIETLPDRLETKISERGTSLSGGQKQRITLARALVLDPKIILLDDFTARVDRNTEKKIFANLKKNYQGITQILITQQIASIEDFDQIILVMEGEILAIGNHKQLLKTSKEYQQIYNSQKSLSE